ncbi:MAG: hypothetical protein HQL57_07795 [Magnetococcales bacterium]|nr:hypothetical protein [Magnetococcales bacterium]
MATEPRSCTFAMGGRATVDLDLPSVQRTPAQAQPHGAAGPEEMMMVEEIMLLEEAVAFLVSRKEVLLADLAIHLLQGPEETRALIEPLVTEGRVERVWRPMKSNLRDLCDCDREEVLKWLG